MTTAMRSQELPDDRCTVCEEPLVGDACPNTVCELEDRGFSRIFTVSERAEETWQLIYRYKYDDQKHLAEDLARMLVEYLHDNRDELLQYDLFTPAALYIGPKAQRLWDYLRLVLDAAERIDDRWPLETDLITKVRPTGRFLGIGIEERRTIAEQELRSALRVPDPSRVRGKRILVIDDVFSEGFTLREMARALREAGAAEVAGLVFARRKGA